MLHFPSYKESSLHPCGYPSPQSGLAFITRNRTVSHILIQTRLFLSPTFYPFQLTCSNGRMAGFLNLVVLVPSHNQLASPCFDLPHCPALNICSIIVITRLQGPASSFHPLPSVILPDQILRVHEEPHYPEPLTGSRKTFVGKKHASGLTSATIQKVNSVSQMSSRSPRPFVTMTALCMNTCQENLQPPLLLLPHPFYRHDL